jgi:DNA-binding transcriptional MerR regulator
MPDPLLSAPRTERRAARAQRPAPLTTRTVCERAGVSRGVLRVYEREGLIAPPARTASGYRDYPPDTPERLAVIRGLKEVGFTLREIALLLDERDAGRIDPARLQALAAEQVALIDRRIARLQVVREVVASLARGERSVLDDEECNFVLRFLQAGEAP